MNFSTVPKIDSDVKSNNIPKVLTVAAVALFILGLLVLSNIILPVVPVKESISAEVAMSSFLLSGISELVSRLLFLKGQSKNIESITRSHNSDIAEENEQVYAHQVEKNITKPKMPISYAKRTNYQQEKANN